MRIYCLPNAWTGTLRLGVSALTVGCYMRQSKSFLPVMGERRQPPHMTRTPRRKLQRTLEEWLAPTSDQVNRVTSLVAARSVPLLERAASWWEGEEIV